MKTCANCGQRFEASIPSEISFIGELGEFYLEETDQERDRDLCPICLEELGMMNLEGFEYDDM